MTKKHFIRLADYISDTGPYCEPFTENQIRHLANFCHEQNPRFDRARWIEYIGSESGPSGYRYGGKN